MGRPKKLSPDVLKLSGRYPAGVLEDPKPIAQRFAHSAELRQAPLRRAEPPRASPPVGPLAATREATAPAGGTFAFRTRLLIAGLILAALVPSLILVGLWLGLIGMPRSKPVVAVPAPQTATPPQIAAPSAVLTAPDRIEAIAGEDVSFPIALDGTDGVPSRSVIAIRGLPQGSNFSEGRPYGDSEWTLKPDQIGDLNLVLPAHANGEFKLGIALIAPDDKVTAEAETLLVIAPAPVLAEQAAPEASSVTSPDSGEATASVPDVRHGDGAEPGEKPMEVATAPSDDASTDAVEQPEDGKSGLGTVQPSVFVNLRDGPSSSAPVLGVIAKGTELTVLDRKRGWVEVTDPATGKKGWIYSGLLAGEAKPDHGEMRVAPAEAGPKRDSVWRRLGRWLNPWSKG